MWHRHPELHWELSALHTHWLNAYDPQQNGSAPIGWHRDFADARQRLRDWVAASGTRLDRDRPTRQTIWPGEDDADRSEEHTSELQSRGHLVCRLLLEKKKQKLKATRSSVIRSRAPIAIGYSFTASTGAYVRSGGTTWACGSWSSCSLGDR